MPGVSVAPTAMAHGRAEGLSASPPGRLPSEYHGLSILVECAMRLNPMASVLFVFGNRRRDRIEFSTGVAMDCGCSSSGSKLTGSSGRKQARRCRWASSGWTGGSTA